MVCKMFGVMNQGLGGNRICHDGCCDSGGVRRFDRDVLSQPGVTHAIVVLGVNDLRNRGGLKEQVVTADDLINGLNQMAMRARARGIKMFGGTITPFENETFLVGAWTPERDAIRVAVNEWMRSAGAFHAVIDFVLSSCNDPEHPARMLPIYDNGDHLHPGDIGYNRMGDVIDLSAVWINTPQSPVMTRIRPSRILRELCEILLLTANSSSERCSLCLVLGALARFVT